MTTSPETSTNSVANLRGALKLLSENALTAEFLATQAAGVNARFFHDWPVFTHIHQQPPAGAWTTWLLLGGRGAGKTRAGAEWLAGEAERAARLVRRVASRRPRRGWASSPRPPPTCETPWSRAPRACYA